jgi:anti-sigma factor RsiW
MTDCALYRRELPLFGSEDLEPSRRTEVEAHLRGCRACETEAAEYVTLLAGLRRGLKADGVLPAQVVRRIAEGSAEAVLAAPWWRRLLPPVPAHGWAAAVPAMVLAVVVAAPFLLSRETARTVPQAPVRLDMQVEGDGVRVAWNNGQHRTYKVFKTTDPRLLAAGSGQVQVVRGHEWVDRNPGSSAIVYYRVE